ncbi:MAG: ABC transporter ATP-binding protein/permease [Clostridia bacterium]|nr:ABC transporter ATP-binding protein/permease [Clostridia bacterium]
MKKLLTGLIKKQSFYILLEIILLTINIFIFTMPSKILGQIIDLLYNIDANKNAITSAILYLLLICILYLITRVSWRMIDAKISRDMVKKIRNTVYEKMLKTDVAKLDTMKNGDIMSYFVKDIGEVRKFVSNVITLLVRFVLNFAIVAIAMSKSTNIKLTLITLCPIIISIILIFMMIKRIEKHYNISRKKFSALTEFVQESTDSIRTTKAYVGEKKQTDEFLNKNTSLRNTNYEIIKDEILISVFMNLGIGIGLGLSILFGGKMVLNNQISVGDFVAFNGYMIILQGPITWLPWMFKHTKKFQVAYERLDKFLKMKEEKIKIYDYKPEYIYGDIEIKNLTYRYPNGGEDVLKNIDIKIEQGKSLGIIGVIGSGKTTLMNLLMKLYKVPDGKIFIDGKDINTIKTDTIRHNICYITQDNFLFSSTLKDNINLFRDIYAEEDILESTKSSMIYEEINDMPDGINTIIGEKGIDLSGGQKQRVTISRAFLNQSNIVIFDDTFSALDNKTEEVVLRNIKKLTDNKTCIIISNRISDIKHCDEIIVLDNGKIVERGIHRDLLANKKNYYEFYKNQAERNKVDILS